MRVAAICLALLCTLISSEPLTGSEPKTPTGTPVPQARSSKPFDLSYMHSRFVAGVVARPRRVLQSPFGKTAIATAFKGDQFEETIKPFAEQFGMKLTAIDQFAVLFSERNIAAINGLQMPTSGRRRATNSRRLKKNLKSHAMAFHDFYDIQQRFPGFVPPGKGKLSWRVHILPFIREYDLYNKFNMDEDWDSETNKPLIAEMPDIFLTPGVDKKGKSAVHITQRVFPIGEKVQFRDFVDGSSNTIMHIVAGPENAIEWTKPGRLEVNEKNPWKSIGDVGNALQVSLADGSVRTIYNRNFSDKQLLGLLTPNDGEVLGLNQSQQPRRAGRFINLDKQPTFIVHCIEPIDQDRILKLTADMFGEAEKKLGNGQEYFDHEGYAIWFPNERSLVATPTSLLPSMMANRDTSSVLRQTLTTYNNADVVGVFDIRGMPVIYATAAENLPQQIPASIKDINHLVGVLNVSSKDDPVLQTMMNLKNDKSARSLAAMGNGVLAYISEVDTSGLFFADAESAAMANVVLRKLTETAITHTGSNLKHIVPKRSTFLDDMQPAFQFLAATFDDQREREREDALKKKMKAIGLAFHNHHDLYLSFGTADGSTTNGRKGGLSWRVHLLPFLDEGRLYQQFRLNEPWDSENNKKLIAKMPDVFKSKGVEEPGKTAVHILLGERAPFTDGKTAFEIDRCIDGTSLTILAVVAGADKADVWTKPGGLTVNTDDPAKTFGKFGERLQALFADGSVHFLSNSIDPDILNAIMTHQGREIIDYDDFRD